MIGRRGLWVCAAPVAVVAVLGSVVAGCADAAAEPAPAPETRRELTVGAATGFRTADGAQAWRAIPYAAPPVGELRWRAPRPPEPWAGERTLVAPAPRCVQLRNAFDAESGAGAGSGLAGTEDCLTLDVYAPAEAGPQGPARPIMVWVHGGGNVWGHAGQYDGGRLAQDENVVVVVPQYRLGPLGFFAHPAIRADAETPEDRAANFALLDLAAALAFVRDNAAAFGGDPERVTLFGESAGGHNVAALLVAPQARGLFHRAIVQSGSLDSIAAGLAEGRPGEAQLRDRNAARAAAARAAGPDADAAALRALSAEAVLAAYLTDGAAGGFLDLPRMIADGVTLPRAGLRAAFESPDGATGGPTGEVEPPFTVADVPVIFGANRDEMKLFNVLDPRLTRRVLGLLPVARDPDVYDAFAEAPSRIWRATAVDAPAEALTRAGRDAVWAYRFDWDEGGRFLFTDTSRLVGAGHSVEIVFVFDRFSFFGRFDRILFNRQNAAGRQALADAMGGYWAAFARDGDPGAGNGAGPRWTPWTPDGALMRFDSPSGGGPEMIGGVETVDDIIADLARDPRLDAAARCLLVADIAEFSPAAGLHAAATTGCALPP